MAVMNWLRRKETEQPQQWAPVVRPFDPEAEVARYRAEVARMDAMTADMQAEQARLQAQFDAEWAGRR